MADMAAPRKLLAVMPNWLGDCVMALPALYGMKKAFPELSMSIAVKSAFMELGSLLPDVAATHPSDDLSAIGGIRNGRYDTALILPNSFNSAWRSMMMGSPRRIGYAGELRSILLTHAAPRPPKHSLHQQDYYANLVKAFFPKVEAIPAKLVIPDKANDEAASLLPVSGKPLVGIGFGASYGSAKMWPAEKFAELIDRLSGQADVVLIGAASDKELEARTKAHAKSRPLSLVGRTGLATLAAALSRLSLYITNDTGPMHLASALGVPVVAIFGPTSPEETMPLGDNVTVIYHKADCAPCWERVCPEDHRCMASVTVDEVYGAAGKVLNKG
ncbi:MAG: lipopolysaccharide heptosyltransferase II [Nitrospinae bacterium]|nr:lipopolysaccharide heptosyltransferase II [Nitrospinota bacterium]